MLGLQMDKKVQIIQNMVDNFSDLIDNYGFIPNGNRTYYLSRSQPPFYALMIELLRDMKGDAVYSKYLKYLEKEYQFWMNGVENIDKANSAFQHVVRMQDGEILNRYWDNKNTPRSEMYREDIETAKLALKNIPNCDKGDVYRNLRSAAESGWDFSSRWLADPSNLYTIQTTNLVPVDLNSLLYQMEITISKAYQSVKNTSKAKEFIEKAEKRKSSILKYCWNKTNGFFMDYDFTHKKQTDIFSLAGVYPLFLKIATDAQAIAASKKIENSFLKQGGVVTTLYETKQQWDSPNGWAPLQWITIAGLRNYHINDLADKIKGRWLGLNKEIYETRAKPNSFKMLEKYDVVNKKETGGGEYPNQDGFGWTNGVFEKLSSE